MWAVVTIIVVVLVVDPLVIGICNALQRKWSKNRSD
jgi:hypothetical protein